MISLSDFNQSYKDLLEIKTKLGLKKDLKETDSKIRELLPKIIKSCSDVQLIDQNQFLQMVNLLDSVSEELKKETEAKNLIDHISEGKKILHLSRIYAEIKAYVPAPPATTPAFGGSDYKPDPAILQLMLADFVGGGEGNTIDNAVPLYKHYLDKYCTAFPADSIAAKIQKSLSHYHEFPLNTPLDRGVNELFQQLERDKYVAFQGGTFNSDAGHAIFCELFLDDKNNVTFKVTNSGDGLQYHPVHTLSTSSNQGLYRDYRYRTLVLSGSSLDKLKSCHYLEALISFMRPRPAYSELKDLIPTPKDTHNKVDDVYKFLLQAWPGSSTIYAENPGGAQRSNSCSVQALLKWIKGSYYAHSDEHLRMSFWIKASALLDYINNEPRPNSKFIEDVIRKLSSQASKISEQSQNEKALLEAWVNSANKAAAAIPQIQKREQIERLANSLQFPAGGIDLSQVDIVGSKQLPKSAEKAPSYESLHYTHRLPGEKPDYSLLPKLSQSYVAPLQDETSYRLNFFRLLPDFASFNFENDVLKNTNYDRNQFFIDLATASHKFFYASKESATVHIPDSFFADLLNAWGIVYLEAKKQGIIPPQVLLEWVKGMIILTKAYSFEYTFDKPETRLRYKTLSEFCELEQYRLFEQLGPAYKPPPNHWEIYDKNYDTYGWTSYGADLYNSKSKTPITEMKDLPEMASFAFKKMFEYLRDDKQNQVEEDTGKRFEDWKYYKRDLKPSDFYGLSKEINRWYHDDESQKGDIQKAITMFSLGLPDVPLYDALRKSLAGLYVFADRYLSITKTYSGRDPLLPSNTLMDATPERGTLFQRGWFSLVPALGPTRAYIRTKRPSVTAKDCNDAEYYVPKSAAKNKDLLDFNERIHTIFSKRGKDLPFFKEQEEHDFAAFVQNDTATCLTELLTFCSKRIVKFIDPAYRKAFEHVLFSSEGGEHLESLFANSKNPVSKGSIDLLFNFVINASKELLSKNGKSTPAAPFFLHMHMRLCYLAVYYQHPKAAAYIDSLVEHWKILIPKAKEIPSLAKSLGEAVLGGLPVIEGMPQLYKHPDFAKLVASTLLLDCVNEGAYRTYHDKITLNYGYQSFKTLLSRHSDPEKIWKEAAEEVLGITLKNPCQWDKERGYLLLDKLSIDLPSRVMDSNDETKMRLLPREIIEESIEFKKYFSDKIPLCKYKREGDLNTYAFRYKNNDYQIVQNSINKQVSYFKKINGEYHAAADNLIDLEPTHCFIVENRFWGNSNDNQYVENRINSRPSKIQMESILLRNNSFQKRLWVNLMM